MTELGGTGGEYKKDSFTYRKSHKWKVKKSFGEKISRLSDKWEKIPMGSGLSGKKK